MNRVGKIEREKEKSKTKKHINTPIIIDVSKYGNYSIQLCNL